MDDSNNPYQSPEKLDSPHSTDVIANSIRLKRLAFAYLISICGYLVGIIYYMDIQNKNLSEDFNSIDGTKLLQGYCLITFGILSPAWYYMRKIVQRHRSSSTMRKMAMVGCVLPIVFQVFATLLPKIPSPLNLPFTLPFTLPTIIILIWLGSRKN